MRPWAWTAHLSLQIGIAVVYTGWLLYGGNVSIGFAFALAVIRCLYSIRERYRDDAAADAV